MRALELKTYPVWRLTFSVGGAYHHGNFMPERTRE